MYKHFYISTFTHTMCVILYFKLLTKFISWPIKSFKPLVWKKDSLTFRFYYQNDSAALVIQSANIYWAVIMCLCEQNKSPKKPAQWLQRGASSRSSDATGTPQRPLDFGDSCSCSRVSLSKRYLPSTACGPASLRRLVMWSPSSWWVSPAPPGSGYSGSHRGGSLRGQNPGHTDPIVPGSGSSP